MKRLAAILTLPFAFAIAACDDVGDETTQSDLVNVDGVTGEGPGEPVQGTVEERTEIWEQRAQGGVDQPADAEHPIDDNAKRVEQLEQQAETMGN